jgi:outer membrane receptor protein involved in Fe transport
MLLVHLLAQAAAAAAPEAVASPEQGVVSYPPAFFAAQQPQNAHEMVLRLPGFAFDDGDSIRGFEGGGGNVLIDGQRPTSKTDNLEEILRRVPASQVERIDLVRGGAPGIDMQGKSVIANVVRKQGSGGFRGLVAVANNHLYDGRNLYGSRLELSGENGQRSWEGSARFGFGADDGAGDGPGVQVRPDGVVIRRSSIESEGDEGNYTLTGAYAQPLAGGKVRINARHFGAKYKFEQDEIITFPSPGEANIDDGVRVFENEVGGRFDRDFGPRTKLELIGLHQTRDREVTSRFATAATTSVFALERETSETIARSVLKYRFDDRLSLEAGAEGALNKLDSSTIYTENGVSQGLPAANVSVEEKRGELFGKAIWRPNTQWTLEGGVRLEGSKITADGDADLGKTLYFVKPRLLASWSPTASTQLRARFERVVGQLDFADFVADAGFNSGTGVTAGNPDLEPEQAWVGEIAIEQRFLGDAVLVLTARHSELSDVIDVGPVRGAKGVFDSPTNIGKGSKDELSAELTLPLDRFGVRGGQLKGDITKRWSSVTDPTTGRKREISELHPLDWNLTFSHDLPRWKTSYGVDVYGGWRETSYRVSLIETVKLKTYVRPFAEYRVRPDLVVRFELANATSRGLRRTVQIFDGPRNLNPISSRIEDQDTQFGRMYYVRIRKTFGA